ncbi:MAG: DUF3244 domain-containing protein [Bacteroidales bacterium]|nr:DUF3244 domain-containing protein [Bacteroidales bacterium]
MAKFKLPILLAMLTLTVAIVQATVITTFLTENVPITLTAGTQQSGVDRSSSILADITGHTLTVIFTQNLGDVTIEVSNEAGFPIDLDLIGTPNGYQCYIPLAGHYTVVFKLDNGDEYSGEFDVTN